MRKTNIYLKATKQEGFRKKGRPADMIKQRPRKVRKSNNSSLVVYGTNQVEIKKINMLDK